jgi:hypothetical protein
VHEDFHKNLINCIFRDLDDFDDSPLTGHSKSVHFDPDSSFCLPESKAESDEQV